MAVLRCPYCGEKVKPDERICSHCGKEFDKPHVDDVDTYFQESGRLVGKVVGFVILWFIVGLVVGFITNIFNLLPAYSPWLLIISFVLTVVVWILK